jgi:hypothetical protein
MGWYALGRCGSGWGTVEGSCECGNEPAGSIQCWEVLECPLIVLISVQLISLTSCRGVDSSQVLYTFSPKQRQNAHKDPCPSAGFELTIGVF